MVAATMEARVRRRLDEVMVDAAVGYADLTCEMIEVVKRKKILVRVMQKKNSGEVRE